MIRLKSKDKIIMICIIWFKENKK